MSISTMPSDISQLITTVPTDSVNKARRSSQLLLPNTFCVLILRMRTGAKAVLKLIRLMQAIMIISNPILTINTIVLRSPVLR